MDTIIEYELVIASGSLKQAVIELLEENQLPTSDIDDRKTLFALVQNSRVIGTGGLEFFEDCALLRRLSIRQDHRGRGWGKLIVHELEKKSREKGIHYLYLLTTTAQDFFTREGYGAVDRKEVPLAIETTSEFSSVCSPSAIVMKKTLS